MFGTPRAPHAFQPPAARRARSSAGLDGPPSTIVADAIARCGTVPGCTTQPLYGSGNAFVAIDADWVYFRKQGPGSDSSLVRAPRRGPNFAAYETLVEKADPEGLITVDESRVYFTHYVDPEMRSSNAYNLESIAKAGWMTRATACLSMGRRPFVAGTCVREAVVRFDPSTNTSVTSPPAPPGSTDDSRAGRDPRAASGAEAHTHHHPRSRTKTLRLTLASAPDQ